MAVHVLRHFERLSKRSVIQRVLTILATLKYFADHIFDSVVIFYADKPSYERTHCRPIALDSVFISTPCIRLKQILFTTQAKWLIFIGVVIITFTIFEVLKNTRVAVLLLPVKP